MFLEKLQKRNMKDDLFNYVDVTSASGSNTLKKGYLDSSVQRGFTVGQCKLRQTTLNKTEGQPSGE